MDVARDPEPEPSAPAPAAATAPGIAPEVTVPASTALDRVRSMLAVAGAFAAVGGVLALALPVLAIQIVDGVLAADRGHRLAGLGGIAAVAGLLVVAEAGFVLASRTLCLRAATAVTTIAESLGAAAASDARHVAELLGGAGPAALMALAALPVALLLLGALHPVLGAVALAAVILLALPTLAEVSTARPNEPGVGIETGEDTATGLARAADSEVARAHGLTGRLAERAQIALAARRRRSLVRQERALLARGAGAVLPRVLQTAVLALGGWLVLAGTISTGAMVAAVLLAGRALTPIGPALAARDDMVAAGLAWNRLRRVARAQETPTTAAVGPAPAPGAAGLHVRIERLYHTIPGTDRPVLRDITLEIEPGTAIGLLGPTGSGKSMLLRALVGVIRPSLGHVRFDDSDPATWPDATRGAAIGYVPQEQDLLPGSLRDNIARLGPADHGEVLRVARLSGLHALVLHLPTGYETSAGAAGGARLSPGLRQRLAIARALYGAPRLVVMDEPTAHLDPAGEEDLLRAIDSLRASGCTLVLATQRVSLLRRLDRLARIGDGRLLRLGDARAVMQEARSGTQTTS